MSAIEQYLHRARLMQRAAQSDRASLSLPAIRRLVATDAFIPGIGVVELHRRRQEIRRRHCLLVLAREAGLHNWVGLRDALEHDPASIVQDIRGSCMPASYPNLWFTTLEEALAYQTQHGGQVLRHGSQAVVVQHHEIEVSTESSNEQPPDPASDAAGAAASMTAAGRCGHD